MLRSGSSASSSALRYSSLLRRDYRLEDYNEGRPRETELLDHEVFGQL